MLPLSLLPGNVSLPTEPVKSKKKKKKELTKEWIYSAWLHQGQTKSQGCFTLHAGFNVVLALYMITSRSFCNLCCFVELKVERDLYIFFLHFSMNWDYSLLSSGTLAHAKYTLGGIMSEEENNHEAILKGAFSWHPFTTLSLPTDFSHWGSHEEGSQTSKILKPLRKDELFLSLKINHSLLPSPLHGPGLQWALITAVHDGATALLAALSRVTHTRCRGPRFPNQPIILHTHRLKASIINHGAPK